MKLYSRLVCSAGIALVLAQCGCGLPGDVRKVQSFGMVDAAADRSDKGYVEFITVTREKPIPVAQVNRDGREFLVASVGINEGDKYLYPRHQGVVVETLRVAEPPGTHVFVIERDGKRVEVPVKEGRITPVEIDYELLQNGDSIATYRMDVRVFEPVPYQKEKLAKAKVIREGEDK